jgi:hypothetical protein
MVAEFVHMIGTIKNIDTVFDVAFTGMTDLEKLLFCFVCFCELTQPRLGTWKSLEVK